MIAIMLLEQTDVIKSSDHVRQLSLTFTGQSDYLATNSTYGGSPINRLGWMRADHVCPYWVGKTVGAFNAAVNGSKYNRHSVEVCAYEFVRGDLPISHREPLTKDELRGAEYTLRLLNKPDKLEE